MIYCRVVVSAFLLFSFLVNGAYAQSFFDKIKNSFNEAVGTFTLSNDIKGKWSCADNSYEIPGIGRVVESTSETEYFSNLRMQGVSKQVIKHGEGIIKWGFFVKGSYLIDGKEIVMTIDDLNFTESSINGKKMNQIFLDKFVSAAEGVTGIVTVQEINKNSMTVLDKSVGVISNCSRM